MQNKYQGEDRKARKMHILWPVHDRSINGLQHCNHKQELASTSRSGYGVLRIKVPWNQGRLSWVHMQIVPQLEAVQETGVKVMARWCRWKQKTMWDARSNLIMISKAWSLPNQYSCRASSPNSNHPRRNQQCYSHQSQYLLEWTWVCHCHQRNRWSISNRS